MQHGSLVPRDKMLLCKFPTHIIVTIVMYNCTQFSPWVSNVKGAVEQLGTVGIRPNTIFFYSCIFSSLCLEEFSLWLPEENLFYKKYAPNQIFIASATPASHLPKRTHAFHEFFSAQEAIYKFLASWQMLTHYNTVIYLRNSRTVLSKVTRYLCLRYTYAINLIFYNQRYAIKSPPYAYLDGRPLLWIKLR